MSGVTVSGVTASHIVFHVICTYTRNLPLTVMSRSFLRDFLCFSDRLLVISERLLVIDGPFLRDCL